MSSPNAYRTFGRTGVMVSPLALGCMNFGSRTSLSDACRIIDRALDAGLNVLDTANTYARGESERVVGEALKRNGRRDRVFLATKVFNPMADDDPNARGGNRRHLIAECEQSLRRLGTDHLDLYQLHRPDSAVPIDETLRALDDLVRSGKVRYLGTSTFAAWQVLEGLWCAKELGLNRFISEQPPYNLVDRRIERELIPMCRTYGLAVMPWSPLGGGIFSGKYQRNSPVPPDSRYATANPKQAARYVPTVFDVVEPVLDLARKKGVPATQLALAWVLQRPGVTCPIIGPRTLEQLEDNLKSLEVVFTPEDLARLDTIIPPGTHVAPFYQADFGPHAHRW